MLMLRASGLVWMRQTTIQPDWIVSPSKTSVPENVIISLQASMSRWPPTCCYHTATHTPSVCGDAHMAQAHECTVLTETDTQLHYKDIVCHRPRSSQRAVAYFQIARDAEEDFDQREDRVRRCNRSGIFTLICHVWNWLKCNFNSF